MSTRVSSRRWRLPALAALTALLIAGAALFTSSSSGHVGFPAGPKPTIVLVHGAWSDASSWDGEIAALEADGYTVDAPADPLRSLSGDAAYIASYLKTISGPIVLVGHSYGGAVITNAATGNPNVRALVYIDAFAPDQGESVLSLAAKNPGSELPAAITTVPYTDGTTSGIDVYIKPADFRAAFAADVPSWEAAVMAATQRPITYAALTEPSGIPAWKTIPSWYLVGLQDEAIPPATQELMAARMHAHTIAIDSSHASLVSHPRAVTDLILDAARAAG
ncbi:MAG TPA: alpha/beta hydrolase [Solirubrobacteraceae bacterium]|nr:alpha/beta hydrolase [Solirubrobacteraceae bacterium]